MERPISKLKALRAVLVTILVVMGVVAVSAGSSSDHLGRDWMAQLYCVDAEYWTGGRTAAGRCPFPEAERLNASRPHNIGFAFSGGGTRSAAATIGQLRGSQANGWLSKVRYLSAVSGGAWAAAPFVFSHDTPDRLLGTADCATDLKEPCGTLAEAVANSKVASCGSLLVAYNRISKALGLQPPNAGKCAPTLADDRTFSALIGNLFFTDKICSGCAARPFSWDAASQVREWQANERFGSLSIPSADRPFLVVGGTVVDANANYQYPRLLPLEMTPMYAGVRQHVAGGFGGHYLSGWAYGMPAVGSPTAQGAVRVSGESAQFLTLRDVLGITGSAPMLSLYLGPERFSKAMQAAAGLFPKRGHWALTRDAVGPHHGGVPHGDGGFTDNLGIMPLLARKVGYIIAFVNAKGPFRNNRDIEALFHPMPDQDAGGTRRHNAVFPPARHAELVKALEDAARQGTALACLKEVSVGKSQFYNIQAYERLNICFVYNQDVAAWREGLPPVVRDSLAKNTDSFANFPWYRTFGEGSADGPSLIDLDVPQVNLLADLSSWNVTHPPNRAAIEQAIPVLTDGRPGVPVQR